MTRIVTSFGKKTEFLLKGHLCREKFLKRKNLPSGVCHKDNCKEFRGLLQRKADIYARMVDSALNFEWCSICRKRHPFDEYLPFEGRRYVKNEGLEEEKEAEERNQYLLQELERMVGWVQGVSPCNCSKRYWLDSTK
jgi:hypothetical protein